jgi:hypothetical protein
MEHVAVACHDAGGAEIISSWLNHRNGPASAVIDGPAKLIFKRKCPHIEVLTLDDALTKSDWLMCGTGWQGDFERLAIAKARSIGKKTVAFLDHWVNYLERFQMFGKLILPDEIWVSDKYAEKIALSLFKETPILLKTNYYLQDIKEKILNTQAQETSITNGKLLYVCEPIAEHAVLRYGNERYWGYTEHDALHFFLKNVSKINQSIDSIVIRPHPSENPNKYLWAFDFFNGVIKLGGKKTLIEEVMESDAVIGCESMAMVIGILAGKRVISSIPPGSRPCQLPHQEIEYLNKLLEANKKL